MRLEKLAWAVIFMGLSALCITIAIQRGSKTGVVKDKTEVECESKIKFTPNVQAGLSKTGKNCTFWQDGTCYKGICEDHECKECEKELNPLTTILFIFGTILTLISTYFLLEAFFT